MSGLTKYILKKGIVIAFGELFLKSEGVRKMLLDKLAFNLRERLGRTGEKYNLVRFRDRFFVECGEHGIEKIAQALGEIFGIAWFAEGFYFQGADLDAVADFIKENYALWIGESETYALRFRSDKSGGAGREDTVGKIAEVIARRVKLDKPDNEIFLETRAKGWFIYTQKLKGAGGLPYGSQGRAALLFSAGIDSPVAAYFSARRGAQNFWIHFHSFPLVSKKSIEKTRALARVFSQFSPGLKVFFVPFSDIQLKIKGESVPKNRVLLYRRSMMRIARELARKEGVGALVTGESLGQVGSQTLTNLGIVEEAADMLILRPLVGMDKEEIIAIAKKIGSYDISIKPQEDCCSLFIPKHPTAEGRLEEVKEIEEKLELGLLEREAMEKIERESF